VKRITALVLVLVAAAIFMGADGCDGSSTSAQIERQQNESNQQRLIRAIPAPALQTSLERKNLVARLNRINKEEMVSYVYLISYGKVMAYYAIRGKVSSLNSYLTAMERVEHFPGPAYVTTEAPDQDGSYGKNADGVFFFTTEGVYVEWKGEYLWADQPLKISQPPELVQHVN
jgi:hypothetical protein